LFISKAWVGEVDFHKVFLYYTTKDEKDNNMNIYRPLLTKGFMLIENTIDIGNIPSTKTEDT